jgi:hypothetical protein
MKPDIRDKRMTRDRWRQVTGIFNVALSRDAREYTKPPRRTAPP